MRGELSPNFFQTLWISMVQKQTKPEFLRFTQCKKQSTVSKFHNIAIIVFAAPVWTKLDSSCTYDFLWMNFQVMLMVIHPWTSTPKGLQSESQGTTPYYLQPFFFSRQSGGYASFKSGSTVSCNEDHNKLFPWDICANNFNHNCSWKQRFETMK